MYAIKDELTAELAALRAEGTYKQERSIASPQSARITAGPIGAPPTEVLNFCANNYLGLADHPDILAAAHRALDERGFGMASVRFICGTQDRHLELEERLAEFLGTDASILFGSCFDANGGVFEALLGPEDAVISDALNHASIIDGIRLCKARRLRYANRDLVELRDRLVEARDGGARRILIVTDGVFSMDGYYAPLAEICDLADSFGALVMVDDSHAVGFVGETGAGSHQRAVVIERVDLLTGTFGKALGGASGGYVAGRAEIVELLRQRARPYLFSNSLAPSIVAATLTALELAGGAGELRERLWANAASFRRQMSAAGFELLEGEHAIVPVMFGDAALATKVADAMLDRGVYVTAFSFPVVPRGQARIRVQLSAAHSEADIEACVAAFVAARDQVIRPH
ncbi:MAG TPA: glycine C-acetyltransferase [Ruania sp.]|nr:glycine C-acetyltransferase [Ruania sp.]